MEYSNKSVYVGEWQNGQRSGKGRLDRGETVTSGNWEYDRIKMASAVDLDEIMKPVYEQKLPANFETFFKSTGHTFGDMVVPNLNLNTFIKPTLLEFLKIKSAEGFIKGHILRKVSNILEKQRMVKEISERIYRVYTSIPNHERIFSPIGDRIDFKFQTGEFKIKWHGINFDNKKRPKFTLDHMIVSSTRHCK
jgi:hypothetical protein